MKGLFFTEFLEMVGDRFSEDVVDSIIDASDLSTDGAYTSIGTYSHRELVQLVSHLSNEINVDMSSLLESFGHYLLQHTPDFYSDYFSNKDNSFDFRKAIEDQSYFEEKNVYPDVEGTVFKATLLNENSSDFTCISKRPFAKFIKVMINECRMYYMDKIEPSVIDGSVIGGLNSRCIIK